MEFDFFWKRKKATKKKKEIYKIVGEQEYISSKCVNE